MRMCMCAYVYVYHIMLYYILLYYIISYVYVFVRSAPGAPPVSGSAERHHHGGGSLSATTYTSIYIYIYIYIYIHTQIHIYIYISFMGTFSRRKGKCSKGMALAFILRGRALHWLSFSEQGEVLLRGVGTPRYLSIRGENSAGRESVCALAAR